MYISNLYERAQLHLIIGLGLLTSDVTLMVDAVSLVMPEHSFFDQSQHNAMTTEANCAMAQVGGWWLMVDTMTRTGL
jgi:hypothetical protein